MDQFSQFDVSDPFSQPPPPPPLSQPLTSASDALSLPPLATYPSREALFEAIQSWAKARGYAFTVGKCQGNTSVIRPTAPWRHVYNRILSHPPLPSL